MEKVKQEINKQVSIKNVLQVVLIGLIGFILGSLMTMRVTYLVIEKMIR